MSTTSTITEAAPRQPDIDYHPDHVKYLARTARRLQSDPSLPKSPLPAGFPTQVEGPIVWEGADWKEEKQWVYELSQVELKEIDDAIKHFQGFGKPLGYLSQGTFPLPTLSTLLHNFSKELYFGRGFFVLRTLPVDKYSREEIAIMYAGIASHVGSARGKQDGLGSVLAHIKDLTLTHGNGAAGKDGKPFGNAAYTTDAQVFHTDVGDLIALLALQTAKEGGTSRIASGARVYNELAKTRPDLLQVLSDPWPLDSFGGDPAYTTRPLLYYSEPHVIIQYSRRHFTGYGIQKRSPNIPVISEAQAEALDAVHYLAEKFSLGLNFQKGDIQFINSLGLLHARDAFVDDPEHTRHLIRLWLRNDELAWKTPGPLEPIWKRLYSVGSDQQRFPLEPEIRTKAGGVAK
ncbi:hypothetical protein HETIRDRAFT_457310 [Heterobasidion irregulare TC 32-1]|uniref:TauD/TfdA-like domain-containing protein n=1 Tax=Heterobasidion irregulare (strain TC 32-1) TaxID=747525 RepID=W4KHQ4_HETIT|nr:uncharacterized protein HETIRDRAFT_457310 [Heterobasidion irregulare TC 32-1]ETW85383.1 hypothetical protein HETIRDRAFT_457310 [Heterobasidion irregulare TC 32-1]